MKSSEEMMKLIMDKAVADERIRAVSMEGSRVTPGATRDRYCDFDITYFVSDVREFTRDKNWIEYFGDILIVQYPEDWYEHPYDYESHDKFAYLIQFKDGNRIDLTLIDVRNIGEQIFFDEPRKVLLNKDGFPELKDIEHIEAFVIRKPSEMEFYNTCNEFRWLSLYVAKGLCREELPIAKYMYDGPMMDMFMKMMNFKVAGEHNFEITTGNHSKYLKRFLSEEEMKRLAGIFPDGNYEDIWNKLFVMYDYFAELAEYVGSRLGYFFDEEETKNVREYLLERRKECN